MIQPVPPHLPDEYLNQNTREKRSNEESRPNDEVFLNQMGQDIEDDVNIATGKKIFNVDAYHRHVIYRKPHLDNGNHTSDYGKQTLTACHIIPNGYH